MSEKRASGNKKRSSQKDILARLTDPKNFPGTHKHRFDESGRGRGKAGRDTVAKGAGTAAVTLEPGDDQQVGDISQILRPNLSSAPAPKPKPKRASGAGASPKRESTTVKKEKRQTGGGSIFDRLTDTSLYTGAHKHRFDESGRGRGKSGRDSVAKGAGSSNVSSEPVYDQQVGDISQILRPNLSSSPASKPKPKRASGAAAKRASGTGSSGSGKEKRKSSEAEVIARLTDPKNFTGAHKHRFDSSGKGRGKAGRTDNDAVGDLSQITRPNLKY